MKNSFEDEIVDEIRRIRQAHAESLDYDLTLIIRDLQRRERASRAEIVERLPRKPQAVQQRRSSA